MAVPAFSRSAWRYMAIVTSCGLGLEVILLRQEFPVTRSSAVLAETGLGLLLFFSATFAGLFPVKLGPAQRMNLGSVPVFASILLLPPAAAGGVAVMAVACYSFWLSRRWFNTLFSVGQHALSTCIAALIYRTWFNQPGVPLASWESALAALGAALVFAAVDISLVGGAIALMTRRPAVPCILALAAQTGSQYLALTGMGAVVAVCVIAAPWAVALPAVALPIIQQLNRTLGTVADAKDEVEAALQRQRRFMTDVAHEIGTPLTSLSGNIDVLLHGGANDPVELRETLADVGTEFNRLASTFSHLLLLAETDERSQVVRRPIDLGKMLGDLAAIWQQLAEQRGLTLLVRHVDEAMIEGDSGRIHQMFSELLENATKYTPTGGVITLELRLSERSAHVTIADNGIGIAPDDLPHVFERFYRASRTGSMARTRTDKGTGLGLAIVRYVVESHGGRIAVQSAPGVGSKFVVDFPLRPPTAEHAR